MSEHRWDDGKAEGHDWRLSQELATGDGTPVWSWLCDCGAHRNTLTPYPPEADDE